MTSSKTLLAIACLSLCSNASLPPGCGKTHHIGYNTNGGAGFPISVDNTKRTYTIDIPPSYNPNTPTPIIISYHGRNGNSDAQHALAEFDNTSFNPNYISVYPQGLLGKGGESAWQGASYAAPGVDDIAFTNALLDHLAEQYCVDDQRIYANGKSNGGGFTDTLACAAGTRFAAFAACSGAFYTDNGSQKCNNNKPIPFLEFHGSNDTTVLYGVPNDGAGGTTPPIPDWLDRWGQRNGCAPGAGQKDFPTQDNGKLNITSYTCKGQQNIVQGYWIEGMGHDWPSTKPNSDNSKSGHSPTFINATPVIIKFFNDHVLSA